VTAADHSKSETVVAIRQSVARLSPLTLRRLREGLFRLELQLVDDMIVGGVDVARVTALSPLRPRHRGRRSAPERCARALEAKGIDEKRADSTGPSPNSAFVRFDPASLRAT
jgi:hypothetical protein